MICESVGKIMRKDHNWYLFFEEGYFLSLYHWQWFCEYSLNYAKVLEKYKEYSIRIKISTEKLRGYTPIKMEMLEHSSVIRVSRYGRQSNYVIVCDEAMMFLFHGIYKLLKRSKIKQKILYIKTPIGLLNAHAYRHDVSSNGQP
jgi:hypothetical protein